VPIEKQKALSGKQPWWWAILHASKRIENRKWNTHYRGPILLHVTPNATPAYYNEALDWMRHAFGVEWLIKQQPPRLDQLPRGGIVGRAVLVDVILKGTSRGKAETIARRHGADVDVRWWMPEENGFVLADVQPLDFRPCKGALNLWNYPKEESAHAPRHVGPART
jgi:hypothetical protein